MHTDSQLAINISLEWRREAVVVQMPPRPNINPKTEKARALLVESVSSDSALLATPMFPASESATERA